MRKRSDKEIHDLDMKYSQIAIAEAQYRHTKKVILSNYTSDSQSQISVSTNKETTHAISTS